jgi:hypothetical protein
MELCKVDQIVDQFTKLNEAIEIGAKKHSELAVSMEILNTYNIDSSALINVIENEKQHLEKLNKCLSKIEKDIEKQKEGIVSNLKHLLAAYTELSRLSKFDKPIEMDPFIVQTAKYLYPNTMDNLQFRKDPPIAGVCKLDDPMKQTNDSTISGVCKIERLYYTSNI